jgi:hypothetical protein
MRSNKVLALAGALTLATAAFAGVGAAPAHAASSVTFNTPTTGQDFTVPAGVCSISAEVDGAQGGNDHFGDDGGLGGIIHGTITVTAGEVLHIRVGGQGGSNGTAGIDGGGAGGTSAITNGNGAGGGGFSEIQGGEFNDHLLVAGGGGGAAPKSSAGGYGTGDTDASNGDSVNSGASGGAGTGGTTNFTGNGGEIGTPQHVAGQPGDDGDDIFGTGKGGDGGAGANSGGFQGYGGGGGGGGANAGGGGAGGSDNAEGGGGGGGAGRADGDVTNPLSTWGHGGNGRVVLNETPCGNTNGYHLYSASGAVHSYNATSFGGLTAPAPIVAATTTQDRAGARLLANTGKIYGVGDGSGAVHSVSVHGAPVGIAEDANNDDLVVSSLGDVRGDGEAFTHGTLLGQHLNKPVVAIAYTPDFNGYWIVAADGGVFTFGNAHYYGGLGGHAPASPIVGFAVTHSGHGYWLVGADGSISPFGDAVNHGSMHGKPLNAPIVGMVSTPTGNGYWLVGRDGGVFSFGDAKFHGSLGGTAITSPLVAITQ